MEVTLTQGTPQDRQIAENFMVAFFNDLSAYDDNIFLNAYGLPIYVPPGEEMRLPPVSTWEACRKLNWWVRDLCTLYVIRADGIPAGYASVLADPSYLPDTDVDFELLDFYIAPKYRGKGIGRRGACAIFDQHRGRWVVYELEKNLPARAFWQRVLAEYTNNNFENRQDGTEQRFKN